MAVAKLEPALSIGEVSTELYGRFDLARIGVAATTERNFFVSYKGGAYSRAGTKFVGFSKQTGRDYPPRLVNFQFSINQGLALEFGNFYMRPILNGAFLTEAAFGISNISQTDPAVVTSNGSGVTAATPIDTGVISTYAPGELITLAGGTFQNAAVLRVTNTELISLLGDDPGTGVYAPADTINLLGGTQTITPVLTVVTTTVVSATIAAGGSGGTDGTKTVTGTTGTGTPFQASVTVSGGAITAVLSITVGGSYTANPSVPASEPVTGASLSGAQLNVELGVETFTITNAGVFTANPSGGTLTQSATSGMGTGATFQQAILGPHAVTISNPGVYQAVPSNPVSQDFSDGTGLGAEFNLTTGSVALYNNGEWVFIQGVGGMTEVNGETFVIGNSSATHFSLYDVYGNPIDATAFAAYTGGGTVARLYTASSPYAEQDLQFLKWTQSKDVMSICCVDQDTLTEYPTYNLTRFSNIDWEFIALDVGAHVNPPTNLTGAASTSGTTWYQYEVTSIDPNDGTESIASDPVTISSAVDIAATAGRITLSWTPQAGVSQQNVYKSTPAYGVSPPVGSLFGFVGYAFGAQFIDSNITADFGQVPPLAKDPFARGAILGADAITPGMGWTTATITINSATGSGAQLEAIIVNGGIVAYLLIDGGKNYQPGDSIVITGDGSGATAILNVGPESGTYPGTVAYFQERRVYAYSLNEPDTYWMSQPGAFSNFDSRIPTSDSDAITGSPWSVEVNGIQWMVPMPGGLVVLTGLSAWQLTGTGGSSLNPQPITPTTQQAQPQAYNGIHLHIPPIRIDYEIIYVQAKGSIYRDLSYNFYSNIYTGEDITLNSSQLFSDFNIQEHAWCEEPFKVLWSIRDDGALLSLTFVKSQAVQGWARHDTNGFFYSICSVTEPPVDIPYFAVQRFPGDKTAYMIERQDNRFWTTLDDSWCVDCALSLPQTEPNATLSASSATGLGAVTGGTIDAGGIAYTSGTVGTVVDDNGEGPGTGAVPTLVFDVNGTLTSITFASGHKGTGYISPKLVLQDPAGSAGGSGAEVTLILDNSATFTASAPIFNVDNIGDVIRMGGGIATITAYTDNEHVIANITSPITKVRPNSGGIVASQPSGNWTLTTPVSSIGGLKYLAGATVTGLADGVVIDPVVVPDSGIIDLPQPSTAVVVGLGFTAQLQSVYLNDGEPTIQGQRKKVAAVTARIEASGDFEIGANQPDGAAQSPPVLDAGWANMKAAPIKSVPPYGSTVQPLWTGDIRIPLIGGFDTRGQVAVQQTRPKPLNILAFIPETLPGDSPDVKERQRGQQQ